MSKIRTFLLSASTIAATVVISAPVVTAATPTAPGTPGAPTVTLSVRDANVSWTAPSDGGSEIVEYKVTANPGGNYCYSVMPECTIYNLRANTTYTFSVTARNAVGMSAPSEASASVTTPLILGSKYGTQANIVKAPGARIAQYAEVAVKSTKVSFALVTPRPMSSKPRVTNYQVKLVPVGSGKVVSGTFAAQVNRTVQKALTGVKGTKYRVVVVAQYANGSTATWTGPTVAVK